MKRERIMFYSNSKTFRELSNFEPCNIYDKYTDRYYKTTEHYFQSMKFYKTNNVLYDKIVNCNYPSKAKEMAKNSILENSQHWDSIREKVMFYANWLKFGQNEHLRNILLKTENSLLVEDSTDYYWGIGATWSGHNRMGRILMKIRGIIRYGEDFFNSIKCFQCKFYQNGYCHLDDIRSNGNDCFACDLELENFDNII